MASNSPFLTAQYEKQALTKQTAKRIQLLYKQSARDIERKLRNLRMLTPSDSLKKVYLENLLKDINKSADSFNRLVQSTVLDAGEKSGKIAVEAGNRVMKNAGLEIKGAYSHIPRQQVQNIASGKLYGDKWSLSKSIWKNGLRTKSDMEKVVAKGLMENKPIKDIADDLTKYVDPTARKPWDWSKVYPGTAAQVDYNAQRLARTMIQHSFQSSLVQSQLYNPFCNGIIWYSVGIHGRTCELCMERDGQVFPVKDLPLDHPNGLCYFEPALDNMDAIADRLADWTNGGVDPDLDTYISKAFDLSPKSLAGKNAVETVKQSTSRKISRGRSVSRATRKGSTPKHKVVNGRDISTTWKRRSNKFDFEIEDVINAQGFDGKPRIVSAKEFDAAVKDSKFIAQRTYSAETKEILEAYRKQLYEGKWYVDCGTGGAQYGQGMYCAANYEGKLTKGILEEMRGYQKLNTERFGTPLTREEWVKSAIDAAKKAGYSDRATIEWVKAYSKSDYAVAEKLLKSGRISEKKADTLNNILQKVSKNRAAPSYTETLTLDPSARIIKYDDLYELRKKEILRLERERYKASQKAKTREESIRLEQPFNKKIDKIHNMDIGSYAASKGYDAINAVGHGKSGSYTVILNRTKVIIKRQKK